MLKKVLRNPGSIRLYRLIHPDLGIPLAHWVSQSSRARRAIGARSTATGCGARSPSRASPKGYDAVMIGHFHQPFEHREQGREFFVLGDWIEHFTYVVLEHGRFRLETWPAPLKRRETQNWVAEREPVRVPEIESHRHVGVVERRATRSA